jgi:hypothetical protein
MYSFPHLYGKPIISNRNTLKWLLIAKINYTLSSLLAAKCDIGEKRMPELVITNLLDFF